MVFGVLDALDGVGGADEEEVIEGEGRNGHRSG